MEPLVYGLGETYSCPATQTKQAACATTTCCRASFMRLDDGACLSCQRLTFK